jgi:putative oxidoreductase
VSPFGTFLQSQGLPAGWLLAIAVTALEVLGSVALALGWGVRPLCLAFALVYGTGIALVHAAQGWFVVGLGRNGSEYSVLLIVCLLLVAWQSPARTSASAASPPDQPH